jgi:hypothetical protein
MSKCYAAPSYLLPDILQYILNEYLDHQDIEVYNRVFNFKFKIDKYMKTKQIFIQNTKKLIVNETYLDDELIRELIFYNNGLRKYEKNYKHNKFDGKYVTYDFESQQDFKFKYIIDQNPNSFISKYSKKSVNICCVIS